MYPHRLVSVRVSDALQIGLEWVFRRVEFLAFWSAIVFLGAYPAVLAISKTVSSTDIGFLVAVHAACLLVGHGYGSSVGDPIER